MQMGFPPTEGRKRPLLCLARRLPPHLPHGVSSPTRESRRPSPRNRSMHHADARGYACGRAHQQRERAPLQSSVGPGAFHSRWPSSSPASSPAEAYDTPLADFVTQMNRSRPQPASAGISLTGSPRSDQPQTSSAKSTQRTSPSSPSPPPHSRPYRAAQPVSCGTTLPPPSRVRLPRQRGQRRLPA